MDKKDKVDKKALSRKLDRLYKKLPKMKSKRGYTRIHRQIVEIRMILYPGDSKSE